MQTFGHETAEKVKDLLYQLDAAPTLADLSSLPPILRNQFSEEIPPLFTVGKAGKGQVLFQPYGYRKGQNLRDIDSIDVISVRETI